MTKRLKAELVAALSMLIIAALMLTTASFAWMTISTAPEVTQLAVSMGTTSNLEIARASAGKFGEVDEVGEDNHGDQTKWGAKVTDFSQADGINWPVKVSGTGVGVDSVEFYTTQYDETGRTNGLHKIDTVTPEDTMVNGVLKYYGTIKKGANWTNPEASKVIAAGYGVWLRTNQDLTADADQVKMELKTNNITISAWDADTSDYVVLDESVISKTAVSVTAKVYSFAGKDHDENVSYKGATGSVNVKDGGKFALSANEEKLVVLMVTIDGASLPASSFTSGAGLKVEGIEVKFSSTAIAE